MLSLAVMIDLFIGDPEGLPHPIRLMGRTIQNLEPRFRHAISNPFISGAVFSIVLIVGTYLCVSVLLIVAALINPRFKTVLEIVLIYYCISITALQKAAIQVHQALLKHDLRTARQKVAMIVGRDPDQLAADGIARATVETVAENLVDGCLAPLFFAFLGGAPFAMAYKMINTLDSMIGYKNERYHLFGKTAARIDDTANFIPARLSIPIIALAAQLLSRNGRFVFKQGVKEGRRHSSPNAGYPEAAFSGALGVRLGGPNYYFGRLVDKPWIGQNFSPAGSNDIKKACDLMVLSSIVWVVVLGGTSLLFQFGPWGINAIGLT